MSSPDAEYRPSPVEDRETAHKKIGIAVTNFRYYQANRHEIVQVAQAGMIDSGNVGLAEQMIEVVARYEEAKGYQASERFDEGLSFAFMYFYRVAKEITGRPLAVIADEKVQMVKQIRAEREQQRMIAGENYVGAEHERIKAERTRADYKELTTPLQYVTLAILDTDAAMEVPEQDRKAFLDGISFMDHLFREEPTPLAE